MIYSGLSSSVSAVFCYNNPAPVFCLRFRARTRHSDRKQVYRFKVIMKRCRGCKEEKGLSFFGVDNKQKDKKNPYCKRCATEMTKRWYATVKDDPERKKINCQRAKAYRLNNVERVKEWARNYTRSPEKRRASNLAYQLKDVEKYREMHRAASSKYKKNNPDKHRREVMNRRILKKGVGGKITVKEKNWLFEFYNHTCLCCGRSEPEIKLTIDHVTPLSKGGKNVIENAQPLCGSCNSSKGVKIMDYRRARFLCD